MDGGHDADVFLFAFEVKDVFEEDLLECTPGFNKEIFAFIGGCRLCLGCDGLSGREMDFDLLKGGVETFEGDRF